METLILIRTRSRLLYTQTAHRLNAETAYTRNGEVSASGYTAGGNTLTVSKGITGGTAFITFADTSWSAAITARGALIYKDGGATVCVLDFGSDKTSTTTFSVDFPAASSTDALIRLS
jgi:hypothetical protein